MNIVRGLVCRSVRKMCFATLIKLEKIKPNIQHCRNNSKIKYQNRRKRSNRYSITRSLSSFGTDISIKSNGVKLVFYGSRPLLLIDPKINESWLFLWNGLDKSK